jgi:hypothetical protein
MQSQPSIHTLATGTLASRTRVVLAVLFGLIAIGVVGMHLLSADHQLATSATTVESHQHHQADVGAAMADEHAHHAGSDPVIVPAVAAHGCTDCDQHLMMLGSCLLAMAFGALWILLAPTRGRSWPSLVPLEPARATVTALAQRPYRIALSHLELSICRT